MKIILLVFFSVLNICCHSQTQADMNKEAFNDYDKSDKLLNKVYKSILSRYSDDTLFLQNLKKSQRLWIKFRDAEMEMKYPNYPNNIYGSIQPLCRSTYIKKLTEDRIKTLNKWLSGTEEGDLCSGSIKVIDYIYDKNKWKATIYTKDSSIWLSSNINKEYRIFGYKQKSINSKKLILLSIFTSEVENNPFNCEYGSYYETNEMGDLKLKYIETEDDFVKIKIIKSGRTIDEAFMLKNWFEFK